MGTIEAAVRVSNPGLYNLFKGFPETTYTNVKLYGLVERGDLYSMAHKLKLYSKKTFMLHEIIELAYSNNRKAPLKHNWEAKLVEYLNSTGFQDEGYTLMEFVYILRCHLEDQPQAYTFGYATTDPTIIDFVQSTHLGIYSDKALCSIKSSLAGDVQRVITTLREGVPYNLMAEMLLKGRNSWVFSLYSLGLKDERVYKLFLGLSQYHDNSILAEIELAIADIKRFLINLAELCDEKVAMKKLLLMIYFPKYAQFIYDSHPVFAFETIVVRKLAGWRREVAMEIDWEGDGIKDILIFKCHPKSVINYYEGYRENLMFDSFILIIFSDGSYRERSGEFFVTKKVPKNFFQNYNKRVIEKEFQGTVYSIIQGEYKLDWGPIDPLSEEINLKFEDECVNILLTSGCPLNIIWLESRYIDIISGNPVPISRLMHNSSRAALGLASIYSRSDDKDNVKAIHKVYESLAYYCQPKEGYLERWDPYIKDFNLYRLFYELWSHSIGHCNFVKSFEVIMIDLESDQIDFLTKRFLLKVLKTIVEVHFSASEIAMRMDFTTWTDTLKNQLFTIFGKSRKDLNDYNDDDDEALSQRRFFCGSCIIV